MSDTSRRRAGVAWLWIDGVEYEVMSQPTWGVSRVRRETMPSMRGVAGYKETPIAGFIAATLLDESGVTVAHFQDMTSVSVTLRLASGKEVSGTGMWTVEAQEVDAAEATFAVRFEGDLVEEF